MRILAVICSGVGSRDTCVSKNISIISVCVSSVSQYVISSFEDISQDVRNEIGRTSCCCKTKSMSNFMYSFQPQFLFKQCFNSGFSV